MESRARHPATCKWFQAVRIDIHGITFFWYMPLKVFDLLLQFFVDLGKWLYDLDVQNLVYKSENTHLPIVANVDVSSIHKVQHADEIS